MNMIESPQELPKLDVDEKENSLEQSITFNKGHSKILQNLKQRTFDEEKITNYPSKYEEQHFTLTLTAMDLLDYAEDEADFVEVLSLLKQQLSNDIAGASSTAHLFKMFVEKGDIRKAQGKLDVYEKAVNKLQEIVSFLVTFFSGFEELDIHADLLQNDDLQEQLRQIKEHIESIKKDYTLRSVEALRKELFQ